MLQKYIVITVHIAVYVGNTYSLHIKHNALLVVLIPHKLNHRRHFRSAPCKMAKISLKQVNTSLQCRHHMQPSA